MFSVYEKLIQGLLEKGFGSVDNWLTPDELTCLRKSLLVHYENDDFHLAGIGNKENLQTVKKIRTDQIYWLDSSKANDCETLFLNKFKDFIDYLNRTCYTGINSYELHYAVYEEGSFYKKHIDQFQNDDRRQFSVVFYLTEDWKTGDGGELILYSSKSITKIEPLPGRMVFFKSELPHEVLTSNTKRLSLTGWLKTN